MVDDEITGCVAQCFALGKCFRIDILIQRTGEPQIDLDVVLFSTFPMINGDLVPGIQCAGDVVSQQFRRELTCFPVIVQVSRPDDFHIDDTVFHDGDRLCQLALVEGTCLGNGFLVGERFVVFLPFHELLVKVHIAAGISDAFGHFGHGDGEYHLFAFRDVHVFQRDLVTGDLVEGEPFVTGGVIIIHIERKELPAFGQFRGSAFPLTQMRTGHAPDVPVGTVGFRCERDTRVIQILVEVKILGDTGELHIFAGEQSIGHLDFVKEAQRVVFQRIVFEGNQNACDTLFVAGGLRPGDAQNIVIFAVDLFHRIFDLDPGIFHADRYLFAGIFLGGIGTGKDLAALGLECFHF